MANNNNTNNILNGIPNPAGPIDEPEVRNLKRVNVYKEELGIFLVWVNILTLMPIYRRN